MRGRPDSSSRCVLWQCGPCPVRDCYRASVTKTPPLEVVTPLRFRQTPGLRNPPSVRLTSSPSAFEKNDQHEGDDDGDERKHNPHHCTGGKHVRVARALLLRKLRRRRDCQRRFVCGVRKRGVTGREVSRTRLPSAPRTRRSPQSWPFLPPGL